MIKLVKSPLCEMCGKKPAVSFAWFQDHDRPITRPNGKWMATCFCTSDIEDYYVTFDLYFHGKKEQNDWDSHLYRKTWFDNADWWKMLGRLQEQRAIKDSNEQPTAIG